MTIHPKLPSQRPAADQFRSTGGVPTTHGGQTEVMKPLGKYARSQLKESCGHVVIREIYDIHSSESESA